MGYFYWYALGMLVPYEGTDTPHIPPAPMTTNEPQIHRCWLGHRLLA